MHIHALCLVKNENDVIEQTLRAAAEWCDWIYVLDNGSTDGTWDTVRGLGRELAAVLPFKQSCQAFSDSLRNGIFAAYKTNASPGDWWCILDADEFYIDPPRLFLEGVAARFNSVWMQRYSYLFTDKDLADYERDPRAFARSAPIHTKLRHYVLGEYAEVRFFRHSDKITGIRSEHFFPAYPTRIRMKHFAYRSPDQIRLRLETRREPMLRGEFLHEKRSNWEPAGRIIPGPASPNDLPQSWRERVVPSSICHLDRGDGRYVQAAPWDPPKGPRLKLFTRRRARAAFRKAVQVLMAT